MKKSLIFLLIIYLVSNYFVFEVRPSDIINYKSEYLNIYLIIKFILLSFCGFITISMFINIGGFQKYIFKDAVKYVILFNLWAFVSIAWSSNKILTSYRAIEFLIGIILFYMISNEIDDLYDLYRSLKIILVIMTFIFFSNIFNFVLNSDLSITSDFFKEVILRSNSGSMIGGIIALVGLSELIENKKGFAIFIFGLFTLIVFKSTSSLILFLFSTVFLFVKNTMKALLISGVFLLLSYLFFDKIVGFILWYDPSKTYEHITNLTGRSILWEGALSLISSNPLLGYGFGISRVLFLNVTSWSSGNAHNGYLASIIELGIIGLYLTIVVIVRTLRNLIWMSQYYPYAGRMLFAILFLIISNNLTIAGIGAQANISWFILFFILFSIVKLKSKTVN